MWKAHDSSYLLYTADARRFPLIYGRRLTPVASLLYMVDASLLFTADARRLNVVDMTKPLVMFLFHSFAYPGLPASPLLACPLHSWLAFHSTLRRMTPICNLHILLSNLEVSVA
jgi:hypothetical protein